MPLQNNWFIEPSAGIVVSRVKVDPFNVTGAVVLPAAVTTNVTFTLGSYASAKVGQYTRMLELAGEPALGGRLQFAGEHTSSEFLGFMNGGVQSGNRASTALIKIMALHK